MQVSWIDPDDLRSLLGQLQQPAAPVRAAAVELHTLPNESGFGARELGIDEGDLWLPDDFAAPAAAVTSETTQQPAPPTEELFSDALAALVNEQTTVQTLTIEPLAAAEDEAGEAIITNEQPETPAFAPEQGEQLSRIRERLQAIRERALEAGLMGQTRPSSSEVPAPVSGPAPPVQPAEEMTRAAPLSPINTTTESFEAAAPSPPATTFASFEGSQPLFEPMPGAEAPQPSLEDRLKPIESPFALDEPAMPPPAALPSAVANEPMFQRPVGSITERLDAFAAWAGEHFDASNLLVVDDHGDILWGDHAQAGLVVSAMMACKAMMRSSALGASGLATVIEQPISADRLLIIVPCETTYGAVSIAFVRDRALTEVDAAILRAALISVVEAAPSPPNTPQIGSALD